MKPLWVRSAEYAGISPDPAQLALMERYRGWLATEAVQAGGIGPAEKDRIDRRHLADSLLFASQMPAQTSLAWDLGSGVGLPAIPLAVCLPDVEFVLVERSGRRVDLLRRVLRILQLENCQIRHTEIEHLSGRADVIVSRASLPPDELLPVASRHLPRGGVAVVAGSWHRAPHHPGWVTVEIPPHVLDQTVWLLIMRRE